MRCDFEKAAVINEYSTALALLFETHHGRRYYLASKRFTLFRLVESTRLPFRSLRLRLPDFVKNRWLEKALNLRIFPLPERLNRFAAPLWVFIFGIFQIPRMRVRLNLHTPTTTILALKL